MTSSKNSDVPLLPSGEAVLAVVRRALSRGRLSAYVTDWYVRRDNYIVAAVACESPSVRSVESKVKAHVNVAASTNRAAVLTTAASAGCAAFPHWCRRASFRPGHFPPPQMRVRIRSRTRRLATQLRQQRRTGPASTTDRRLARPLSRLLHPFGPL